MAQKRLYERPLAWLVVHHGLLHDTTGYTAESTLLCHRVALRLDRATDLVAIFISYDIFRRLLGVYDVYRSKCQGFVMIQTRKREETWEYEVLKSD